MAPASGFPVLWPATPSKRPFPGNRQRGPWHANQLLCAGVVPRAGPNQQQPAGLPLMLLSLFFSFSPPQFSRLGILTLKERSENVTQGCANADTGRNCCLLFFPTGGFPLKPCRCFQLPLVCFRHSVSLDQQTEVHISVNGSRVVVSLRVSVCVVLRFCSGRGTASAFSFSAIFLISHSSSPFSFFPI